MLTLFLATLVVAIATAFATRKCGGNRIANILCALSFGALGGVLVGALLAILLTISLPIYSHLNTTTRSYDLVSIKTDASVSGSFFLGTGSLSGEYYYLFYWEDDNGIHFAKIPMSLAVIHENNAVDAKLVMTEKHYQGNDFTLGNNQSGNTSYDFYVPQGSIDHSIDVSLP